MEAETLKGLNRIARVYRKFYNLGLCYQSEIVRGLYDENNEYITNPQVRIPREAQVIDYTFKVYENTPSAKGVSKDIIKAAAQRAYRKFMTSYKKNRQVPRYMSSNSNSYSFRTVHIGVSEDSINLSGMGDIKVYRKSYLPQCKGDSYQSITFTYDGRNWWVSFVDTNAKSTASETSEPVTLELDEQGNLLINGEKLDENVFLSKKYRNVLSRYEHFKADFKRKSRANEKLVACGKTISVLSKNMLETKQKMLASKHRLEQMKLHSFARVASAIKKLSPSKLYLPSTGTLEKLRKSPSFQLTGGEIQELFTGVSRRIKSPGVKIARV
jgi:hypothetical protein